MPQHSTSLSRLPFGCDPLLRIHFQHLLQEVYGVVACCWHEFAKAAAGKPRNPNSARIEFRPFLFCGGSHGFQYSHKLILFALPRKERFTVVQLGHDATQRKNVHRWPIFPQAENEFWCPIPASTDVSGVWWGFFRGPCEPKVTKLGCSLGPTAQNVLWFKISMEEVVFVHVLKCTCYFPNDPPSVHRRAYLIVA